jgi:hypothetical protein
MILSSYVDFMISSLFPPPRYDLVAVKSTQESSQKSSDKNGKSKKTSESEFISDKFKSTSDRDLVEIQENMTRLGMAANETKEDEKTKDSTATGKKLTWNRRRAAMTQLLITN